MKTTLYALNPPSSAMASVMRPAPGWQQVATSALLTGLFGLALVTLAIPASHAADAAADHGAAHTPAVAKTAVKKPVEATSAPEGKDIAVDIKAALRDKLIDRKSLTLVIKDKPAPRQAAAEHAAAPAAAHEPAPARAPSRAPVAVAHRTAAAHAPVVANPRASRDYIKAKAAALTGHEAPAAGADAHGGDAHGGDVHWAYDGENGPQNWGKLKPDFNVCAIGKRQSPINIEESATLQGPAEPLQFNYTASSGSVVNNGHTIQVDLYGDNTLTVRGSVYKLVQFHFHTPSEEQVNFRNFAMVAHLVHKNNEGQLAVVAVLLDPGVANTLINKVWTYMPLDTSDRVRLPGGIIDMNELLPKDQRYYQFIGSLTTPPCTEGVLWMVMKQPTQLSREQIRLFQQLFPSNNARPVQPVNGRAVRNAQ
ncbi:MAG: carbonic anhydrase family protein [Rhodoferax sp.]|uniref:carbonic anhydrase n=1 Tax=Rhodoferax sp. TaxID=50421 RepID=UPI00261FB30D|nr:carbonic anhydrase family protein [Rhodoferax sp.]MDD2881976.1 carbonic anhydrase family protein [Rhodoferax sp.]